VTVDMVPPGADLTAYDLVIVPTLYTLTDADARAIVHAAEEGATVLITPFSGIVDEHDTIRPGGYPGAFRDLLGTVVDEFRPLAADAVVSLASGRRATIWSEQLRVLDAEVRDVFADGPAAASPALTRRAVGAGSAWYTATVLDDEGVLALLRELCAEAGVPALELGPDVDIVNRVSATERYTFIINHRTEAITVPVAGHDLVSDERIEGSAVVPAGAVRVIASGRSDRGH